MISVANLVKRFGSTVAVDGVTFEIPKGQVVGFLGPNGAGKTTTMRVLTGYLPPDEGEARLLGRDLAEESLDVRRRLGYLPENNPLPDDVEVTDYLHYIGTLRGLHDASARMARVRDVVRTCSLATVVGRKLGELSKGFRQRVGLAQAIVHDPDILILDEPTSGLDPNQVLEVRHLISDLKKEKTLLLSTHILSEVQSTCDRVIIINRGKIVADGAPELIGGHIQSVNRLSVALNGPRQAVEEKLKSLPGVVALRGEGAETAAFLLESAADNDLREAVFRVAVENKWPILEMKLERLGLEEIFRALTVDEPKEATVA